MSVELLGGRILAPYFGGSIYVWGSIITIFMLALSAGYLVGGRISLKNPSFTKYGTLFAGSSIALLPLLMFGEQMMEFIFLRFEDPRYGSLIASTALFFIPTTILGMIAPYSIRLLVPNRERSGHTAGFLYFVSTLGSAIGTLATSFYFVLWFEVNQIIGVLLGLLFLFGVIAIALEKTGVIHVRD